MTATVHRFEGRGAEGGKSTVYVREDGTQVRVDLAGTYAAFLTEIVRGVRVVYLEPAGALALARALIMTAESAMAPRMQS